MFSHSDHFRWSSLSTCSIINQTRAELSMHNCCQHYTQYTSISRKRLKKEHAFNIWLKCAQHPYTLFTFCSTSIGWKSQLFIEQNEFGTMELESLLRKSRKYFWIIKELTELKKSRQSDIQKDKPYDLEVGQLQELFY